MDKKYDYTFIGGDKRFAYMAVNLMNRGFRVIVYGMNIDIQDSECISNNIIISDSLAYAVISAETIICPIPFSRDNKTILSKDQSGYITDRLTIDALIETVSSDNFLFGGCIPQRVLEYGNKENIFMYDYMKNEELTIFNTIATAEGAIADAIMYQPSNLHKSDVIIFGYGRCAKALSARLKGLCANVTIAARSETALADAQANGYKTVKLSEEYPVKDYIGSYEYIFNTVPFPVIDDTSLKCASRDSILIDIAPGGFNYDKALEYGLNTHLSLGLPGKYSPKSSASALTDLTLKTLITLKNNI